ncbi:MAG: hypothetical protein ACOCWQ_04250 [Nanoarchaeota archaeon]
MKIITCNLGLQINTADIEKSARLLKKEDADIIVFQEVAQETKCKSSLEIINQILHFEYLDFSISHDHSKDYGKGELQKRTLLEGLGMLSKLPSVKREKILPITKGLDRWPRLAVRYQFKDFSLTNLHLSKYSKSRTLEVDEIPPSNILAGDFNMLPEEFLRIFPRNTSYGFREYVSYPSKEQTLDYFVLRSGVLQELKIIPDISDHNAICVKILL